MFGGSVRASSAEHSQPLPGDDRIPSSIGALTHAVTINAAPAEIWPWLVQMGAGRAGWYSYDMLDNGGHYSANSLLPEYQQLTIGTLMPALPGVRDGFIVLAFDPLHHLVLGWGTPEVPQLTTWVFVLAPVSADRTRLLVRARAGPGYRLFGLPPGVSQHLARPVHWLMQRKQLLGIKRRVESAKSLAGLTTFTCALWSFGILVQGVAEAQRVSAWEATGSIIGAVMLGVVVLVGLVMIVMDVMK